MKLITLGDSITKGTYMSRTQTSPNSIASPTFSEVVKEAFGYDTLVNYGFNGTSVSELAPVMREHAMVLRYKLMDADADTLIVAAGFNDFMNSVPLGTEADREDISFFGALDVLYRGLKERYPNTAIYVVTPIHASTEDENKLGLPLTEYIRAIRVRAEEYGFDIIDGFGVPINPKSTEDRALYIKDGVHPNTEGHRLYGEYLVRKIRDIERAKNPPREICEYKTYCNPLSIPSLPRGKDGNSDLIWTGEKQKDYHSISDPSVLYFEGKWYLYPSYGILWESEDFVTWKSIPCTPYEAPGYSPAPMVHNGKVWLAVHSRPMFVADSPKGPFTEVGKLVRPNGTQFTAMDPAFLKDDDGRIYLYWADVAVNEKGKRVIATMGAELDPERPNHLITEPKFLFGFESDHEWERFGANNQDVEKGWCEGQWMIKQNGRYYLIYSGNGTQFETYAQGVYYSDEGPLSGFVYQKNNPLTKHVHGLVSGAGHGCVVQGPDNTLWTFYTMRMGVNHVFERRIGMDRIYINEDGELYCKGVTDTPQYGPGEILEGDVGILPLTFQLRARVKATSMKEGRECFYALEQNLNTWWQPDDTDPLPQITVKLAANYRVSASRVIWQDMGLDYDAGILSGPIKYKIELSDDEVNWTTVLDCSDNDQDLLIDYRTFPSCTGSLARLTILGAPQGIRPGVISFSVFGKREV